MFSFVKNAIILGLNIHQLTVMSEIIAEWRGMNDGHFVAKTENSQLGYARDMH